MKCRICPRPLPTRRIYCDRCYTIVDALHQYRTARCKALIPAYDPPSDGFRCFITGVLLSVSDKKDPWYLNIIRKVPDRPEDQIVVGGIMTMFKGDLTLDELLTVVPALDDTLNHGQPFPQDIIPFSHWYRIPGPPAAHLLNIAGSFQGAFRKCKICIRPAKPASPYCDRCHQFIGRRVDGPAREKVMIKFYDPAQDGFPDAYLGYFLNDTDRHDPRFMTMDHVVPGRSRMVPTSYWLNEMKGCLSPTVFKRVIAELARHIRTGEPFDKSVITKREWNRNLIYMRLAGRMVA